MNATGDPEAKQSSIGQCQCLELEGQSILDLEKLNLNSKP